MIFSVLGRKTPDQVYYNFRLYATSIPIRCSKKKLSSVILFSSHPPTPPPQLVKREHYPGLGAAYGLFRAAAVREALKYNTMSGGSSLPRSSEIRARN